MLPKALLLLFLIIHIPVGSTSCLDHSGQFLDYEMGRDRPNYLPWDPRKREQERRDEESPFEPLYDEVPPPDWDPPKPREDDEPGRGRWEYDPNKDPNTFEF